MKLDEPRSTRRPRSQIVHSLDTLVARHDIEYPLPVLFGQLAIQQYVDRVHRDNLDAQQDQYDPNYEHSQMVGNNDSIQSIPKISKISDIAIGDDEYQTDIEIKRLDQYSPELNKLNKEEMRDISNRPKI